jgi:hypothetical protein
MKDLIKKLKDEVTDLASKVEFIHHKWYVKYHLLIVEKIADELKSIYIDSDSDITSVLVWVHDYPKIVGIKDDSEKEIKIVIDLLLSIGFDPTFSKKIGDYLRIFESKMDSDLSESSIEIQIVSSADGASHLVGPFMGIWLYENSDKDIETLLESNLSKIKKDWERKIVLPEVKSAFLQRHSLAIEANGQLPDKVLNSYH